jgi:tetratricopeptide (TPR) repeat protein
MSYSTDLTQALYYLQQAAVLAPKDPDIHLFSGQIFEAIRQNDKAEFQYKAAVVAAEQNPLYRSRLGDFYQRRNKVLEAIRAWDGGAEKLRPDFLSRKIYFWNKMVTGMALGENEQDRIRKTDAISVFLLSLPTNRFFNEHLYRQAGLTYKDMSNYQELFWLKLTDALQKKNEKAAFEALCDSKFSDSSFSIDILNGIKVVNTYRRLEQFPEKLMNTSAKSQTRHSFFRDLEACQYEYWLGKKDCVSQELSTLMKSPYGYSAVFLAGGWFNAAISLATGPDGKLKTFGRSLPQWYRYGMSVAVGKVFGPDIAMKILGDVQAEDRELYLLVSEHLLAMGRYKDAVARLQTLITRDDAPAYRAAFLLVNMHVASRRLVEAIRIINTVPSLAESDTGITLKARIFHSQGNEEKAQKLYERLASPTAEQKGYLLYRNRKLGNAEIAGSLMNGLAKEHGHNLSVRKYIIESLSHSSDQKGEKENVAQNTSETSGGTNE